jgi:hypothetical protein
MPLNNEDLLKYGAAAGLAVAALHGGRKLLKKYKDRRLLKKYGYKHADSSNTQHYTQTQLDRKHDIEYIKDKLREEPYDEYLGSVFQQRGLK